MVATKINNDPQTNKHLRILFIPNYNASKEHIVVPSVDFNEQISLPGEEACTTISEKFILNGALIIGSHDATNQNIAKHIGQDNISLFGMTYDEIRDLKKNKKHQEISKMIGKEFKETVKQVLAGNAFGTCH